VHGAGEVESGEPHKNTHLHMRIKVEWNMVGGRRVRNWTCNELYKFVTSRCCANQVKLFHVCKRQEKLEGTGRLYVIFHNSFRNPSYSAVFIRFQDSFVVHISVGKFVRTARRTSVQNIPFNFTFLTIHCVSVFIYETRLVLSSIYSFPFHLPFLRLQKSNTVNHT
jgi:hypothetical protein